jgi:mitochondrial import receptor subunit TOM40
VPRAPESLLCDARPFIYVHLHSLPGFPILLRDNRHSIILIIMGAVGSKERNMAVPKPSVSFFSGGSTTTQCDAAPPPPLPETSSNEPSSSSLPIDESSGEDDSIAAAAATVSAYSNPGPFEQASQDAKQVVMLDTHDGFRCNINKQLSPYMAVVHSFWLGTNMIPDGRKRTYTWLTQVADESSYYLARVDPSQLSVDGRMQKSLFGGLAMGKMQINVSPEGQTDQCLAEIDFSGEAWTANLKYGSMIGGLAYGCNFFQAVTPRFSMGGEGLYLGANQTMITNYLMKYTIPAAGDDVEGVASKKISAPEPSSTLIAGYNTSQSLLTLNYKRVVTPSRVNLGAELTCNPVSLESQVVLGAEFKWSRSKLQVAIDGTAKMQSVLETKLGKEPGQPTLSLSAELDHLKDEMRFGYGLNIDG